MFQVTEARREAQKAIIGFIGSSGSGKTVSALLMGYGMMKEKYPDMEDEELWKKIGVADTEHKRSMLYVGQTFGDLRIGGFQHIDFTPPYNTERYIQAIKALKQAGCEVVIVDSLSHQWQGEGGVIETHSKMSGNSFQNWGELSSETSSLIKALTTQDIHILATLRTKTEYVVEVNERGKAVPSKVGTKPVQKDDMEYEFIINFHIDMNHRATTLKDNTQLFSDKPRVLGTEEGSQLYKWLELGVDVKAEQEKHRLERLKHLESLVQDNEEKREQLRTFETASSKSYQEFPIDWIERAIKKLEE